MPPRKKAADASAPPPTRATRSSTRAKTPVPPPVPTLVAQPPVPVPVPATKPEAAAKAPAKKATKTTKTKSRGKSSQAAVDEQDEDNDDPSASVPASNSGAAETDDEEPEKTANVTKAKPKSKRARAASDDEEDKPVTKKAKTVAKPKSQQKDVSDEPQAKMVTVLKRGAAPVDPCSGWVDTHQVLSTDEGVWDATLNQTDVSKNANKFYVIQLLHPVGNTSSCTLFTRWGRVGENGQQQKKGPFSPSVAVSEFKKQFRAKASVAWESRHGMVAAKGRYQWIERVFEDEEEESEKPKSVRKKPESEKIPDSTLEPDIQNLCRLIFNTKLIDAHLSSMNYDANKLPLGKLAKSTILAGFSALKTLSEVITQPNGDTAKELGGFRPAAEHLTGRYYSIIPHVFGRNRPTIIDTMELLKRELDLVDALGDMEVASQIIQSSVPRDGSGNPLNPLDANFLSLQLSKMESIDRKSNEFNVLQDYARATHGSTHRHFQVTVQHAYRVERESETEAWMGAGFDKLADGERLLLWHGSRTTNFAGILRQGLRIAPPEAPVSGYMFGKGVYFADMMSKSANYCHAYLSDNTGLLLLCEVAARPFLEQQHANYDADADCKAAKKRCTKGLGLTAPTKWQDAGAALDHDDLKGCHMPAGPGEDVGRGASLQYNEYIVYDTSQIRLRYLLMVKMS